MACSNLSSGLTLGCDNNIGGIKAIYITEKSNVTSVSLSSPGDEISSIVMSGQFYEFEFNKNTSSYTEELASDQAAGRDLYTQTVTLVLNRREKTKRDKLILLAQRENLLIMVKDQNDVIWYFGETNGMNLTTSAGGSGVAKTDANQYVLTFVGEEPSPANTVTAACLAANT
jgi:hypothetical protein